MKAEVKYTTIPNTSNSFPRSKDYDMCNLLVHPSSKYEALNNNDDAAWEKWISGTPTTTKLLLTYWLGPQYHKYVSVTVSVTDMQITVPRSSQ